MRALFGPTTMFISPIVTPLVTSTISASSKRGGGAFKSFEARKRYLLLHAIESIMHISGLDIHVGPGLVISDRFPPKMCKPQSFNIETRTVSTMTLSVGLQ